jgi:acetylornithine deacetylase/succinyl-diaminopimelate desuccinylase-like protein
MAMKRAFGMQPGCVREGGSIPIVSSFEAALSVPAVFMGVGLNDDQIHAPNEKLDLVNFYRGIEASAYLMEELGRAASPAKPRTKSKPRGRRS